MTILGDLQSLAKQTVGRLQWRPRTTAFGGAVHFVVSKGTSGNSAQVDDRAPEQSAGDTGDRSVSIETPWSDLGQGPLRPRTGWNPPPDCGGGQAGGWRLDLVSQCNIQEQTKARSRKRTAMHAKHVTAAESLLFVSLDSLARSGWLDFGFVVGTGGTSPAQPTTWISPSASWAVGWAARRMQFYVC